MRQPDPAILEVRDKPWIFTLLGLAAFAPGVFMLLGSDGNSEDPAWVFRLLAIPFLVGGTVILLLRFGHVFNQRQGVLENWWGIIVPLSRRTRGPLAAYRRVILSEVRRGKGRNEVMVFPVQLESVEPEVPSVNLFEKGSYQLARAQAEAIAHFMDWELVDKVAEDESEDLDLIEP